MSGISVGLENEVLNVGRPQPMSQMMAACETLASVPPSNIVLSRPQGWWHIWFGFPALLGGELVTTVLMFAHRGIGDPDIWWHLRNAEELVRTGHFVRADAYSYTVWGAKWINHEWLGELPYYAGWRWLGLQGLYVVMALALVGIFLLLYLLAYRRARDYRAAALACGIAIPLTTVSFGPRTLLFGWIFLLLELLVFQASEKSPGWLWALPLLFTLWVNTHGSWLIGIVLLLAFSAASCFEVSAGRIESHRRPLRELKQLATVATFCVAALFLNPYGWRLVFYPFDLAFRQKLNVSHVEEWQSPDFHSIRGKLLLALVLAFLVLILVRRSRLLLHEVLFLLIALYAAFTYSRFLFLAAIMVTPLLAAELSFLRARPVGREKPVLNLVMMTAMLSLIIWQVPSNAQLSAGISEEYPVAAIGHLSSLRPVDRVLNDYDWGGYLIWHARQVPVFVDSRVDIFEYSGVFADYLDIMGLKNSLALLRKHHVRYVLYGREKALAYLLRNTPEWKVIYEDKTAVLFERVQ